MKKQNDYKRKIAIFLDIDETVTDSAFCTSENTYINGSNTPNDPSAWLDSAEEIKTSLSAKGYTPHIALLTSKSHFDPICLEVLVHLVSILTGDTFGDFGHYYTIHRKKATHTYYLKNYRSENETHELLEESDIMPALHIVPELPKALVMSYLAEQWGIDPNLVILVDNNAHLHALHEIAFFQKQCFHYINAKELEDLAGGEKNIEDRTSATLEVLASLSKTVKSLVDLDIAKREKIALFIEKLNRRESKKEDVVRSLEQKEIPDSKILREIYDHRNLRLVERYLKKKLPIAIQNENASDLAKLLAAADNAFIIGLLREIKAKNKFVLSALLTAKFEESQIIAFYRQGVPNSNNDSELLMMAFRLGYYNFAGQLKSDGAPVSPKLIHIIVIDYLQNDTSEGRKKISTHFREEIRWCIKADIISTIYSDQWTKEPEEATQVLESQLQAYKEFKGEGIVASLYAQEEIPSRTALQVLRHYYPNAIQCYLTKLVEGLNNKRLSTPGSGSRKLNKSILSANNSALLSGAITDKWPAPKMREYCSLALSPLGRN